MRTLRSYLARVLRLPSRSRDERDFSAELDSHVQSHIDDNMRAGLPRDEARRQAIRSLYGVEQTKEQYADQRGFPFLDAVVKDLRYALRTFAHAPAFSLAAVVILAVGIGANTAMFSIVNAVVLRPLPFADSSRIMRVWHTPPPNFPTPPGVRRIFSVSPANFLDWQAQQHVFEKFALYGFRLFTMTGRGEAEPLPTLIVTEDFFGVLGIQPVAGRLFTAADFAAAAPRVVMLRESVWRTRFGADRSIFGQPITLNGDPYAVVGVVPDRLALPDDVDLWMPFPWTPQQRAVRSNHTYLAIAKLKRDADIRSAQAEMTAISERLELQYPADDKGWGAVVLPLQEDTVADVSRALFILLGAVLFVVLIGSANLANLLLGRTLARAKELAVRTALGASRLRIVQQVLTETMLLAVGGGALGLLLGRLSLAALTTSIAQRLPRAAEIDLDGRVLVFTAAISVAAALIAGLVPAWRLTHSNPNDALRTGAGHLRGGAREHRVRNILVVGEVALALVLLTGAGLLLRTLAELHRVDAGFDTHNLLTMGVTLPSLPGTMPVEKRAERLNVFIDEMLRSIRRVPGVESAAAADSLPLSVGGNLPIAVEGQPSLPISQQPIVAGRLIGPGYLDTVRMKVVAGRDISDWDIQHPNASVLVSAALARRFWPNGNPIGKRMTIGLVDTAPRTVVGVVNDVKLRGLNVTEPVAAVYIPFAAWPSTTGPGQVSIAFVALAIRTTTMPESTSAVIVKAIHGVDASVLVRNISTMDDLIDRSVDQQRFAMMLISAFAALSMLLAAVGIYSVLSYSVTQRVAEIGIRRALGASRSSIVQTIVADGARPVLVGVIAGVGAAALLGRVITSMLFGVSPHDAATFTSVPLGVIVVALMAMLLPAYRATRVDPNVALRTE